MKLPAPSQSPRRGTLVEIDCGSVGSRPWVLSALMTKSNMCFVRFSSMKLSGPLMVLCLADDQVCHLTNGHGGWIYHVVTDEKKTIQLCWQIQYLLLWHYQDENVFIPNELLMVPPPWTPWVMCSEQTSIWSPWCGESLFVLLITPFASPIPCSSSPLLSDGSSFWAKFIRG